VADARLVSRILVLLEAQRSLEYEEVAAQLDEPPDAIRETLSRLRGLGLVKAGAVGALEELEAHAVRPASRWRLTVEGREKLVELRAAGRAPP
jgi:predicted ArsR family transcriptional regulator